MGTISIAQTTGYQHAFSVSADQQVYFSPGNLQYRASTNTWRFAINPWDFIGSANSNISETYDGWIDLFGWGTSGYHEPNDYYNEHYQPWSTSTSNGSYYGLNYNYYGYGPSTSRPSPNLTGSSANYDWGYNAILNGSNQENSGWRTLTKDEWVYVFNTRSTPSDLLYAMANVNSVNGVILLPDDWSADCFALSNTNTSNASFSSNTLTLSQWNALEQYGAVFLPAAGDRYGTSVYNVGSSGYYWSASYYDNKKAYSVFFDDGSLNASRDFDRY